MTKCTVYAEGDLISGVLLFTKIVLVAYLPWLTSHWAIAYRRRAPDVIWPANKPPVRDHREQIHHIAFTRAPAVLTASFYCYHEHYHVGARPLLAMQHWCSQHSLALGWTRHMPSPQPICQSRKNLYKLGRQVSHLCHKHIKIIPVKKPSQHTIALYCLVTVTVSVRRLA